MRKSKKANQKSTTKKSMKDCSQTPRWLTDILQLRFFRFNLDVCCLPATAKCRHFYSLVNGDNGLKEPWSDRNFCNPPFSDPIPWIKRADHFARYQNAATLIITPDSQETEYCRLLSECASLIVHMPFRLQFQGPDNRWLGNGMQNATMVSLIDYNGAMYRQGAKHVCEDFRTFGGVNRTNKGIIK